MTAPPRGSNTKPPAVDPHRLLEQLAWQAFGHWASVTGSSRVADEDVELLETLVRRPRQLGNLLRIADVCSRSIRRAANTTFAPASPSASVKVTPSPDDAPVTIAVRPDMPHSSQMPITIPQDPLT
jgi:hypothetical protein